MLGSRTHWLRVSEDEPAEPSLPASGDQAASSRPLGLALTPAVGAGGDWRDDTGGGRTRTGHEAWPTWAPREPGALLRRLAGTESW